MQPLPTKAVSYTHLDVYKRQVLREGDILFVPEYVSTVKINGAVMYPNTVLYKKGESLKYYINQAGGFASLAKKKRAFVVYMNGTVSRLRTGNSKAVSYTHLRLYREADDGV